MRFESEITIFKLDSVSNAIGEGSAIANQHLYWSDSEGIIISRDEVRSISQFTGGNVRIGDDAVGIYLGQTKVAEYGSVAIIGNKESGKPYLRIGSDGLNLYDRLNRSVAAFSVANILDSGSAVNYFDIVIPETSLNGYSGTSVFSDEYYVSVDESFIQLRRQSGNTTLNSNQVTMNVSVEDGVITVDYTIADDCISDAQEKTTCTLRVSVGYTAQVPAFTLGRRTSNGLIGMYSFVTGRYCSASGNYAVAMGMRNNATNLATASFGYGCNSLYTYSMTAGRYVNAPRSAAFACGMYNDEDETRDALFVVGNGTSDNDRSNAFYVNSNGDVVISGNLIVSGTVTSN